MSIKNKVTGNFPSITVYNSSGNILGLSIPSTINATAPNAGGLIVTSNSSNLELSTAIGNGNIVTGKNLSIGNTQMLNINTSQGNVINVYASGTFLDVEVTLAAKGDANIQVGSNAYFTSNVVQGNNTSAGSVLHTLYSNVNASAANVGALRIGNAGNVQLTTAIGNGNIISGGSVLSIGGIAITSPILTISSANTTNSFIAFNRAGTTRYSLGADNTSTTGNLLINGPGGEYLKLINSNNTTAGAYLTSVQARVGAYRKTQANVSSAINNLVTWDITDSSLPSTTMNAGVFTNTGAPRKFNFNFQMSWVSNAATNLGELDIWFAYNDSTTNNTNRFGQYGQSSEASQTALRSTSWTFYLNTNDTVRCYSWAGSSSYNISASLFGQGANYSTRLYVTEVL